MRAHGAHAATDVTGFGLLGHARNLAVHTTERVRFEIHTLPCIARCAEVDAAVGGNFRLAEGLSAETSGGILAALQCLPCKFRFRLQLIRCFAEGHWCSR